MGLLIIIIRLSEANCAFLVKSFFLLTDSIEPLHWRSSENCRCTSTVACVFISSSLHLLLLYLVFFPGFTMLYASLPSVLCMWPLPFSSGTSGSGALTFNRPDEVEFSDNIVGRTSANPVRFPLRCSSASNDDYHARSTMHRKYMYNTLSRNVYEFVRRAFQYGDEYAQTPPLDLRTESWHFVGGAHGIHATWHRYTLVDTHL